MDSRPFQNWVIRPKKGRDDARRTNLGDFGGLVDTRTDKDNFLWQCIPERDHMRAEVWGGAIPLLLNCQNVTMMPMASRGSKDCS